MAFPHAILKAELTADPLIRGYASMTDSQAAASLNTVDRFRNRESMTGDELFQQSDTTEFAGLAEGKQNQWLAFCGRDIVDPFAGANVQFVIGLFGGGSATVIALNAARPESVSRLVEIGLPPEVSPGDIGAARAFGA